MLFSIFYGIPNAHIFGYNDCNIEQRYERWKRENNMDV